MAAEAGCKVTAEWPKDMNGEDETPCLAARVEAAMQRARSAPMPPTPPSSDGGRSRSDHGHSTAKKRSESAHMPRITKRRTGWTTAEEEEQDLLKRVERLEHQGKFDKTYFDQIRNVINRAAAKTDMLHKTQSEHDRKLKLVNDEFLMNFRKEYHDKVTKITEEMTKLFESFDVVLGNSVHKKVVDHLEEHNKKHDEDIKAEMEALKLKLDNLNDQIKEEGKAFAETTTKRFENVDKTLEMYNKEVHDQGHAFSEEVAKRLSALETVLGADPAKLERTAQSVKEMSDALGENVLNFEGKLKKTHEYIDEKFSKDQQEKIVAFQELEAKLKILSEGLIRNDHMLAEKVINIESFDNVVTKRLQLMDEILSGYLETASKEVEGVKEKLKDMEQSRAPDGTPPGVPGSQTGLNPGFSPCHCKHHDELVEYIRVMEGIIAQKFTWIQAKLAEKTVPSASPEYNPMQNPVQGEYSPSF